MTVRTNSIGILVTPLSQHKLGLVVAIMAAVIAQACGIALPYVARLSIHETMRDGLAENGITPNGNGNVLIYAGLALFTLAIVRGSARWTQAFLGEKISHNALAAIRMRMYEHVQLLSMGYFDRRPVGKILIRFTGDSNALRSWMARTLISVPADILTICLVLAAIFVIQPILAIATILPLSALPLIMLLVNPHARRLTRMTRMYQTRLVGLLNDVIPNIRLVKAYGLAKEILPCVEEPIQEVADAGIRRGRTDAFIQAGAMGLATVSTATVVLTGLWLLGNSAITPGDLLIVVWISLHIRGPVNRLSRANVIHQRAMVAADRISNLMNRKPEHGWSDGLASYLGPGRKVEFRHVHYLDAAKNSILEDYSMCVDGPGLHWLGSEGSTVIDILLRIRRPHHGRVFLDGIDIRTLRNGDIRSSLGLIARPEWTSPYPFDVLALLLKWKACAEQVNRAWQETSDLAPGATLSDLEANSGGPMHTRRTGCQMTPELGARITFTLGLLNNPPILLIDDPFIGCPPDATGRITAWIKRAAATRLVIVATRDQTMATTMNAVESAQCFR